MSTDQNSEQQSSAPRLCPGTREHLGAHLQAAFSGIEGEPIPDDQIDLLLALRRAERDRGRQET